MTFVYLNFTHNLLSVPYIHSVTWGYQSVSTLTVRHCHTLQKQSYVTKVFGYYNYVTNLNMKST